MGRSHRFLFPLYVIVFLANIGYSSMIAVFTPMMMFEKWGILAGSTDISVRMTYLGLLLALYPFGQFLGSPIIVSLARRFDKKRILLFTLSITALAYAWIAWSLHTLNLASIMAAVFFAGLSEANESIAEDTLAEISPKEQHSTLMSYLHVSSSGAFLFGPILSGILSLRGLEAPFWGIFFILVAGFLFTLFLSPFPTLKQPANVAKAMGKQFSLFSLDRFHFAFAVNALIYFAIFGFFRTYPMHLVQAFGFNIYELSYYIAWVAVPIVFLNLIFTGKLLRIFQPSTLLAWGSLGMGLSIPFLLQVSEANIFLWLSLFLTATFIGICLPSSPIFIARSAHKSPLGEALESDLGVLKGAEALAALCGGALAAIFIQLPLIVFAILALLSSLLLAISKKGS
jgi:predicted MFS family arabinose efflux permease